MKSMRALVYVLLLAWVNLYICRDLFFGYSVQMGSLHGAWTAIADHAAGGWWSATWWPYWFAGMPFESTHPPLVPALAAAIAALRGITPAVGFQSVTGLVYILGPCTLFLAAWRLTGAAGYSFIAALFYSLANTHRFEQMVVWDHTPHAAALVFLPLVILFLARSIEIGRPAYYAAAAICIAGCILASTFGPVMVLMAAACLLFVLRRGVLLSLAIIVWGWAIAAPFASLPAVDDWSVRSFTALSITVMGWVVIWHFLKRWSTDWRARFISLFAWLTASIPLTHLTLDRHFLPQPERYRFETELALALGLVLLLQHWIVQHGNGGRARIPFALRATTALVLLALAAEQVVEFRQLEKKITFPRDIAATIEYRAATWAWQNYPDVRFFLPGSIANWANAFTRIQQLGGGAPVPMLTVETAVEAIGVGRGAVEEDARRSLLWLKAYGVGAVAVSAKDSQEYARTFLHPEKFQGTLPALWSQRGVTIYRVPLREFTLAHIVPSAAIVRDLKDLERYVAALDDTGLPGTSFQWESHNRIRIRTTAAPGQVVTVQESFHPGWHATVAGAPRTIEQDALGLMYLNPACTGPCEIVLDYDGGWCLRLRRWLSWLAMAGLLLSFRRQRSGVS